IFSTIQTRNLAEVMFDRRLWNANLGKERFRRGKHSNIAHSRADCPCAERISRPVTFRANRSQLSEQGLRMSKVCRRSEVDEIMSLFQVHDYRKPFEISSSVIAEFYDAKHIPGSASVFLIVRMEK